MAGENHLSNKVVAYLLQVPLDLTIKFLQDSLCLEIILVVEEEMKGEGENCLSNKVEAHLCQAPLDVTIEFLEATLCLERMLVVEEEREGEG